VFTSAAASDEPNAMSVEFAEDVGLAFNASDSVRWPEGYGRPSGGGEKPFTLPAATWHCIEILYDGPGRSQQLYIDGALKIDAKDFPAAALNYSHFRFGYNSLHSTERVLWYDDLAVGPTRIGCL
jgi:hypothetical protein